MTTTGRESRWTQRLFDSRVWRSFFRHGMPTSNRTRAETVFSNVFLHLHPVKVSRSAVRFSTTFCLGGLSLACFILLTATGIMLMLYYHPSVPRAYTDMKDLEFVVSSGRLLRNMHRWTAHLMVFLVFAHMVRVFYAHAYRPPREFNWVVGISLLIGTLLLSYTGYLLPWDQLAFWGVSVGTNMVRATPVVGERLRFLLLGGNLVGENALIRFYVLHCVVIPVAVVLGMAVHFWRVRKDGGVKRPL